MNLNPRLARKLLSTTPKHNFYDYSPCSLTEAEAESSYFGALSNISGTPVLFWYFGKGGAPLGAS